MIFGIITATAICPSIIATKTAIEQGQKDGQKLNKKGQNLDLVLSFPGAHPYRDKFQGAQVVLKGNKLYVHHSTSQLDLLSFRPFSGYYLSVPEYQQAWAQAGYRGDVFVTAVGDSANTIHWIYVDRNTHELKYGTKEEAKQHFPGPWDCTPIENRVLFEGWEGFVVVQEDAELDLWALYFDKSDDGLTGQGMVGDVEGNGTHRRMLYIRMARVEATRTLERQRQERENAQRLQEELEDDKSAL
ncbi:hypothetical protein L204_105307 [Cryptococcus depauperatus]|nr:hypothetical protein L204_06304 [Cryptococcus depauperatus CBS 7855]